MKKGKGSLGSPPLLPPESHLSCFSDWHAPFPQIQRSFPRSASKIRSVLTPIINVIPLHSLLQSLYFFQPPSVSEYQIPFLRLFHLVQNSIQKLFSGLSWRDATTTHLENGILPLENDVHSLENGIPSSENGVYLPLDPTFHYSADVQAFLSGRLLLLKECQEFSLAELKQHFLKGYLELKPGITITQGTPQCHRCGNKMAHRFAQHRCDRCGKMCLYCRECLEMGQVRECTPLVSWRGPSPPSYEGPADLAWNGKLTMEQSLASKQLGEATAAQQDFLIWAVCGAGKTEILYETIQSFVRRGKRVAVAAPRSDVIIELERRFTQVFPDIPIAILYGDSPTAYSFTPLVLTTLHQLRRFQHAFDLIMIDEVDAFPFHGNVALQAVLQRALKRGASKVFVTATPTREMKTRYLKGQLKGIHLPIRFHRALLPEPKDQWVGNWRAMLAKGKVPKPLLKWMSACLEKQRVIFLFVPDKKTLSLLVQLLKDKHFSVEGAHSEDPERREKVLAFREGKHSIMVATTILERGVTVPFAAVGVLGAETELFDERALVQMAGRSGRDTRDPEGDVVFFHYGKTREMARAHAHIRFMNKEGAKANARLVVEDRVGGGGGIWDGE